MQALLRLGLRPAAKKNSALIDTNAYKIFLIGDSITAQNNGSNSEVNSVITGITKANPCVITLNGHAFSTGEKIYLFGIQGMSELNENIYTVTKIDANNFSINTDSTNFSTFTGYGRAFRTETNSVETRFYKSRDGFYTYAEMLTGCRFDFRFQYRRGIAGDPTAAMNTRKNYELLARFNPQIVHILGGRNDINSSVPNATILANLDAMISYCTNTLGAKVILGTVTPNDTNTAAQKDQQDLLNAAIRQRASGNVFVADYYTAVADSGTRNWKSGYAKDVQHPGAIGALVMGQVLRDVIKTKFGYGSFYTPNAGNVLANPNLSGTGGTAAGITVNGLGAGWTGTLAGGGDITTRTFSKNGNDEQVMSFNYAAGLTNSQRFQLQQTVNNALLTPGAYYVAEAEISLDNYSGSAPLTELCLKLTLGPTASPSGISGAAAYFGTPLDDILPSAYITESGTKRLHYKTLPIKHVAGNDALIVILARTNNLSAACSGAIRVHRVQLYQVPNPYV